MSQKNKKQLFETKIKKLIENRTARILEGCIKELHQNPCDAISETLAKGEKRKINEVSYGIRISTLNNKFVNTVNLDLFQF